MQSNQKGNIRPTAPDVVVAVFTDSASVRDAIADLNEAGFEGNQVQVAFSAEGKRAHEAILGGQHSVRWRLEHGFEHDLHRRGADQMSGQRESTMKTTAPPYTEVDMQETLAAMGVAQDRIQLLDWETGANGSLLLVHTGHRAKEVQRILEHNCGVIRTDTATERPCYVPDGLSNTGRAVSIS
jgi:hypothetical protein